MQNMSKQAYHAYQKRAGRSGWGLLLALTISLIFLFIWLVATESAAANLTEATRIAYWQLEENGAPYIDNEQSLAGTCVNCPTRVTGQVGFGQEFNGSSTGITVDADPNFNWTTDDSFTIELWLKTDANACASGHQYALARGSSGSGHWAIGCSATTGLARFELSTTADSTITLESTRVISDGNWHHLVAIYDADAGNSTLYLDRTDIVSTTTGFTPATDITPTAAGLQMGHLNNSNFFAGVLDEVALYSGRLSQAHIGAHYYLSRPYNNLCSPDIRIMPLGDSITVGTGSATSGSNTRTGYRKPLYLALANDDELNINFVGSNSHGDNTFDQDHQGVGGATALQIGNNVNTYLTNNPSNIVLLHTGTNDLTAGEIPTVVRNRIATILNNIDNFDQKITVVLAQIINRVDGDHLPTSELNFLLTQLVDERQDNGDKLILVNMETGAGIDYRIEADGGDMFSDGLDVHPAISGYEKMAVVWHSALLSFLSVCTDYEGPPPAPPVITSIANTTATVDEPYSYQVTATGNPAPAFALTTSPTSMNINSSTGLITWTPTAGEIGNHDVIVTASNSEGTDTQSFTITVSEAAQPPACQLNDTLAYWRLDDGSGATTFVEDYGGHNGTCTAPNCPTFTDQGRVNGAFTFDGTNRRINVPASTHFNWGANDSFSIELWANIPATATCSGERVFIGRFGGVAGPVWGLGCEAATNQARFLLVDSNGQNRSITANITPLNDSQWHHIVGVRDGLANQTLIYVDGVPAGSTSGNLTGNFVTGNQINIGYLNTGAFFYLNGTLDEIAIHNRALTPGEIARHYAAGQVNLGYEYDNWTTADGGWNASASWYGDVPGSSDYVAVFNDTNLTANTTAACVDVMNGATLDFGGNELTVDDSFNNRGTVKQNKTANDVNTLVDFLHVQNTAQNVTKYRGVEITPTDVALGNVEVSIRAANFDDNDYCTTDPNSPDYAERCFTINPATSGEATVRLYAHTDELAGLNVSELRPYRFNGSWSALPGQTTGAVDDFVYAQAATPGFSSFLLGGNESPTAVSLAALSSSSGHLPPAPITLLALFLLLGSGMVYVRRRSPPN